MKPNVIPTPENFDENRVYLYDDPSIIEKFFAPADCQRKPKNEEVRGIAHTYLSGDGKIIPPITVNVQTLSIEDGLRRWNGWKLAYSEGYRGPFKVLFIDVPKEREFKVFCILNSGEKVTDNHINGYAESTEGIAPNTKKVYGLARKYPKFLVTNNGRVKVQNLECLVYGEKKKNAVRFNGDHPEVTDEMLAFAEKVAQESEVVLDFKNLDLGGNSCRDFFVVWRRVRQNPDVSAVVDRLGLAKVSELVEVNAISKPFGKTYGVKRWQEVLSFLF